MDTTWYDFNVSLVASVANFTLTAVLLVYLLSLPAKKLEAKLFNGYLLAICLYHLVEASIHLVVNPAFDWVMMAVNNILLAFQLLLFVSFAYHCGGNPYKREFFAILMILALLVMPLLLFDLGTLSIGNWMVHFVGVIWIGGIFGRKAKRVGQETSQPTPVSIMLRGFQKWAFIILVIWLIAAYNPLATMFGFAPFEYWYYVGHPLNFIQITYATIVFLNYTPQPTSFQAKVVGLVLSPLLIILVFSPFLLQQLIVDLPNFDLVIHQISLAFLILIPISALAVTFGLPRFLRSNLLSSLNQILEGVRQVDAGNLLVEVPETVNDEVGKLARQFNSMTRSLHRYGSEMETLVEERTHQLQQSLNTLKSTQAQLIQSEKMASLGELTAGIAHEIQNPLNFVNNFSEVSAELVEEIQEARIKNQDKIDLETENEILSDLKENLSKITLHGKRADAIVKGMLEHSKRGSSQKELTDINTLAEEFLRLSYQSYLAKDKEFSAELQLNLDPDLPKIEVVPQDLGKVLLNLYSNAFYACAERSRSTGKERNGKDLSGIENLSGLMPKVTVSTKTLGEKIEISVSDNGTGIPDSIKDKIFQPFFTTKPTGSGTGLGLSLSYDIVKAHGGDLRVKSIVAEGSTFIVYLPITHTT
jgi:two-component system, NtrC family, sensor kinase